MHWVWWGVGGLAALAALGALAEGAAEAWDRGHFPPPGEMVDVGGRRLHILCKGQADGPTVVIEQGAGSPSMLWWPMQDKLAAFARVCVYDRAGYLWSDGAARVRTLDARVADLQAVLHGAHVPGPYLMVAHSFGGPLVRRFAQSYPGEVGGMVLVDTPEEGVIFRSSYIDYAKKIGVFARVLEMAARFGVIRVGTLFMSDIPEGLTKSGFAALKAMVAKPAFFRAMGDDAAALARVPLQDRKPGAFGQLGDMPLVVITHGIAFPGPAAVLEDGWLEGQHRLVQLSTQGDLVVATKSNHMVQSDEPEIVIAAVKRVLALMKKAD